MKSKKRPGISGILLIVLILVGMIVWGIFTGLDRRELSETLDKTTLIAKINCRIMIIIRQMTG